MQPWATAMNVTATTTTAIRTLIPVSYSRTPSALTTAWAAAVYTAPRQQLQ
jgi:hypothetical protein